MTMKKQLMLILSVVACTAAFGAARFVKATDSNVSFTGRVLEVSASTGLAYICRQRSLRELSV